MSSLRLADYIEAIHFRERDPSKEPHRPFNNGLAKNPPLLRRRGPNRILLFPGSFNPLHQGHLDLLRHVFENAGDDFYIIAAIVIMTDDERLSIKMSEKNDSIVFSREQRVNLWRGVESVRDWAWVYDKSENDWSSFQTELTTNLRKKGLELKFTLLGGPDYIGIKGVPNLQYWNCSDAITSDISRPVDFRCPNSMRQLPGHTMWEKPSVERARLERQMRARLRGKPENTITQEISMAFSKLNAVWVCHRLCKPKGSVRFIQYEADSRTSDPPSSTWIRDILSRSPEDDLKDQLRALVPSMDILITYLPKCSMKGEHNPKKNKLISMDDKVEQEVPADNFW